MLTETSVNPNDINKAGIGAMAHSKKEPDATLAAKFPAADASSGNSFTPPVCNTEQIREPEILAYMVISKGMSDKSHSQWRACSNIRWLSGNVSAIYASMSPAAALLESLAKNDVANDRDQWMLATLRFPAKSLLCLDNPMETWKERPYRAEVRAFGDQWAAELQSLALRVPSAVCPYEHNVLINTAHPDFESVAIESLQPLEYDMRLTR